VIVRSFLKWYQTGKVDERREAVLAMATSYLTDQLGSDSVAEAEAALTLVLDDPSSAVRQELAWAMAPSTKAPRAIIVGLAHDVPQVAGLVLARSPLLRDADLVDCVATGGPMVHLAVALRRDLTRPVTLALARCADGAAMVALCCNPRADIAPDTFRLIASRHAGDAEVGEALAVRKDLPAGVRQTLVQATAARLAAFVGETGWLDPGKAQRIATDCAEMQTIALAREVADPSAYVEHLRVSAQLTPTLLLRSLLCGDTSLFGAALVALTGMAPARVAGILKGRSGPALLALCGKSGLPKSLLPAFEAAVRAAADLPKPTDFTEPRLSRPVIAAAMAASIGGDEEALRPVLAMLRRFDAEAAREEARRIAEELMIEAPEVIEAGEADALSDADVVPTEAEADAIAEEAEVEDIGSAAEHYADDVPPRFEGAEAVSDEMLVADDLAAEEEVPAFDAVEVFDAVAEAEKIAAGVNPDLIEAALSEDDADLPVAAGEALGDLRPAVLLAEDEDLLAEGEELPIEADYLPATEYLVEAADDEDLEWDDPAPELAEAVYDEDLEDIVEDVAFEAPVQAPAAPQPLSLAERLPLPEFELWPLRAQVAPAPMAIQPAMPVPAGTDHFRDELDALFASTFGEGQAAPSAEALRVIEDLADHLDERFFNNLDIRRKAA
jgi:uncharacterized protein (DUF2336 family)